MRSWFVSNLLFSMLSPCLLLANDKLLVVEEHSSLPDLAKAKEEIRQKAIDKVALNAIRDLVGSTEFIEHQKKIYKNVMPKKGHFIPFVKNGKATVKDGITYMSVTLKFSLPDLRAILLQEGFFQSQTTSIAILPLFAVLDEVENTSYRWWQEASLNAKKSVYAKAKGLKLMEALQREFARHNLSFIHPMQLSSSMALIPKDLKKTEFERDDLIRWSQLTKTHLLLMGHIRLYQVQQDQQDAKKAFMMDMNWSIKRPTNDKMISQVTQTLPMERKVSPLAASKTSNELLNKTMQTLVEQTLTILQAEGLKARQKRLILVGDLTFQQVEMFKSTINRQVAHITKLRERLFKRGQIIFEMQSEMKAQALAQALTKINFEQFQLTTPKVSENNISFQVLLNNP